MGETRQDHQCGSGSHKNHTENYGQIGGSCLKYINETSSLFLLQETGYDISDDYCHYDC